MKHFDEYMKYRLLDFKFSTVDNVPDSMYEAITDTPAFKEQTKNFCVPLAKDFVDLIEQKCAMLGIPKRRFAAMALMSAMDRINELESEIDVFELMRDGKEIE